jgi:hypothetical protein
MCTTLFAEIRSRCALLRNSLSIETVEKLAYIKTNYPTIADCLHVSDSEGMSSSEEDECDEEAFDQ